MTARIRDRRSRASGSPPILRGGSVPRIGPAAPRSGAHQIFAGRASGRYRGAAVLSERCGDRPHAIEHELDSRGRSLSWWARSEESSELADGALTTREFGDARGQAAENVIHARLGVSAPMREEVPHRDPSV